MNISYTTLEFIKKQEGFSAVPYQCPAGIWTVGYGHTKGVNAYTMPITPATAEDFLCEDIENAEAAIEMHVKVPLTAGQYDALASLVYNIGEGNFKRSTLLRRLNAEDYEGAADEFLRWIYAAGKKKSGLEKRRKAERELFLRRDNGSMAFVN